MSGSVIGIDFGTSFSSAAVYFNGQIKVIQDERGSTFIPSVVCFREKEKVGAAADILRTRFPMNTIYEIKRVVGCRYDDPVVQSLRERWKFELVEGIGHRVKVRFYVNDKKREYHPEYIISKILQYIVQLAEKATNDKYTKAVITVPANFNDTQRKCIRNAASFVNLEVLRIMDEPVAAAVAISIQTNIDNSCVLVYDMGGGTFDISILEVTVNDYRVVATDGDPCLGGADFTNALLDIARQKILADQGIDTRNNARLEIELRSICENIKIELSAMTCTRMELDLSRYQGDSEYVLVITREEFENAIRESIIRSVEIVRRCMETYNVSIDRVSGIALVGGSSSIPLIRTELHNVFPTLRVLEGFDPREVVCRGALVQALNLCDEPIPTVVTPAINTDYNGSVYGISDAESVHQSVPAGERFSESFQLQSLPRRTTDVDGLQPLTQESQKVEVPDHPYKTLTIHPTTPLDLGIRLKGMYMDVIIKRNEPLPVTRTKTYVANKEHPDYVRCVIYQGNNNLVANNVKIGVIKAQSTLVSPNACNMITITFAIDVNGAFSASAMLVGDKNAPVEIEMTDSVVLTPEMIKRINDENLEEQRQERLEKMESLKSQIDMYLTQLEEENDEDVMQVVEEKRAWLENGGDSLSISDLENCLDMLRRY